MGFLLFGLTGGLASGKSTVAALMRARGIAVIDADQIAREVVLPGTEGNEAVVQAFGLDVRKEDGSLDRAKLADIVFNNPEQRRRLNSILHPRIAMMTQQKASQLAAEGVELACYEAALLVENGLADMFRPLVVVAVPEEVQVKRAMERDHASLEQAKARLAAQLPLSAKVAVADYVIENSGDKEALEARVDEVLSAIRAKK